MLLNEGLELSVAHFLANYFYGFLGEIAKRRYMLNEHFVTAFMQLQSLNGENRCCRVPEIIDVAESRIVEGQAEYV
jgi:hypothetical protein